MDILAVAVGQGRQVAQLAAEGGALFQINLFWVIISALNFILFFAVIWAFAFKPVSKMLADRLGLSHKLGDTLAANVFLDTGGVTLNRNTWANWNAANPRLNNRYTLSGIGVGLDWRVGPAVVTASIATPLGSNPGRDANDKNIDGSPQHRTRGWIGANAQF